MKFAFGPSDYCCKWSKNFGASFRYILHEFKQHFGKKNKNDKI